KLSESKYPSGSDQLSMYRPNCSTETWTSVAARGWSRLQGTVDAAKTKASVGPMPSRYRLPPLKLRHKRIANHHTSRIRIVENENWRLQYGGDFPDTDCECTAFSNSSSCSAGYGSAVRSRWPTADEHPCGRNT